MGAVPDDDDLLKESCNWKKDIGKYYTRLKIFFRCGLGQAYAVIEIIKFTFSLKNKISSIK